MKNLFIIGTPLQLLNAIEAIKYFQLDECILVIVHRSLKANKVQIEDLKNMYKFEETIDIEYSKNSSMMKYVNLVKYLKKYRYSYIFFPKLETVPKLVLPNVKKEKVFLLDDGVLTVEIYDKFIKKNKLNKYNLKEIRFLLFGLKIKIKDKINFFTYFDLEPLDGVEIIKNKLSFIKETYLNKSTKDDSLIYFIGHPPSKAVDNDTYMNSILTLVKKFNKKIIYIPHRGETEEGIKQISSLTTDILNVLNVNMPIELYFLKNKIYPTHIISYYSTALTTLNILYPESKVSYVHIPNYMELDKNLINIYKTYTQKNFTRLDIL